MHRARSWARWLAVWVVGLAVAACDAGVQVSEAPSDDTEGVIAPTRTDAPAVTRRTFVVTDLAFVDLAGPGVADGFDLDAVDGPAGCGQPDLAAPDGRVGIDNQLAGLLPILRMTEAAALDGLVQEAVSGGLTMFIVEVDGLGTDDLSLRMRQGDGPTPILDTAGRIEADQTFRIHPESPDNRAPARREGDVITTADFVMAMPATVLNASFTLHAPVARIELVLNPDGSADGILGGAVLISGFVDLANTVATSIGDLATNLLRSRADLLPDADGRCTAMSAYFRVHLEPAFVAEWD